MNSQQRKHKRISLAVFARNAAVCGIGVAILVSAGGRVRAQQEPQTTPNTQNTQPAIPPDPTRPAPPNQPAQEAPGVWTGEPATVVQPAPGSQRPGDPDSPVHATGGIINSHPEDIFNRPGDYAARVPDPTPPDPTPAPIPASNLSELNQTPDSVQYADRARGPYRVTLEESGVWSNNLFNVNTGQLSGAYFHVALPFGIQKNGERTTYGLYYRPDYTVFPQYTQLNHFSQNFTQQLDHKISDLTDVSWNVAGGRVVTTGQFIPSTITVGSTTVVQTVSANNLEYSDNLATNVGMTRRLSERDSLAVAATAAWLQQPEGVATDGSPSFLNRSEMAGVDLHLTRLLSPRTIVGVEANDIFVRGLSPVGHSNFLSFKGTMTTMLSQHVSLVFGGGPLFGNTIVEAGPGIATPQGSMTSYAANGGVIYETSYAKISGGYERSLEIGYLGGPLPTNDFFGVFDRPVTRNMDLVVDTRYGRTSNGVSSVPGTANTEYSMFGVTSRLSDNITPSLAAFVQASHFQQNAPGSIGSTFGRTDISGGLTYSFGIPLTRRGDRQ